MVPTVQLLADTTVDIGIILKLMLQLGLPVPLTDSPKPTSLLALVLPSTTADTDDTDGSTLNDDVLTNSTTVDAGDTVVGSDDDSLTAILPTLVATLPTLVALPIATVLSVLDTADVLVSLALVDTASDELIGTAELLVAPTNDNDDDEIV